MFFGKPRFFLSMAQAREELARDASIRLVDVRGEGEYATGRIPGSVNLPLERLAPAKGVLPDLQARIFVYCLSGARSRMALAQLAGMGYKNVTDIGGILQWTGSIEGTRVV